MSENRACRSGVSGDRGLVPVLAEVAQCRATWPPQIVPGHPGPSRRVQGRQRLRSWRRCRKVGETLLATTRRPLPEVLGTSSSCTAARPWMPSHTMGSVMVTPAWIACVWALLVLLAPRYEEEHRVAVVVGVGWVMELAGSTWISGENPAWLPLTGTDRGPLWPQIPA
jgi:hypothetical protein